MRLDENDLKNVAGRTVYPVTISTGNAFVDPWGVVWFANSGAISDGAAPGHVIVQATQISITADNTIATYGDKMNTEIPVTSKVKVLHPDVWKAQLAKLFPFTP